MSNACVAGPAPCPGVLLEADEGRLIHIECRAPSVRQEKEELAIPPSRRISSSGYGVSLLWRWNLRLNSDITAAIGACRARIAAAFSGIPVGRLPAANARTSAERPSRSSRWYPYRAVTNQFTRYVVV